MGRVVKQSRGNEYGKYVPWKVICKKDHGWRGGASVGGSSREVM